MCVWWGDMRNGRGYCWLISGVGRASKYIMEWNGETMLNIESFYDSSCTEGIYFDYIPRILERAGRICGYWCKHPWSLSLKQLPKHLHSAPPEWSNGSQSFLSSLCSRITSPVQFNCLFVSFCFQRFLLSCPLRWGATLMFTSQVEFEAYFGKQFKWPLIKGFFIS